MSKKIALYVEGQTEQVLVNHFIKTWWNYSDICIQNLKLRADGNAPCKVPNFPSQWVEDPDFLIIDVEGSESLPSIIAGRANRQHGLGYKIIGLRDLDYENLPICDLIQKRIENFRQALDKQKCQNPEKINLFFAIMEIDTWLLAFTDALSKWSRMPKEEILNIIINHSKNLKVTHLEQIPHPAGLRELLGKHHSQADPKSYDSLMSLITPITREEIQQVYESQRIPSFNKFWDDLT